MDLTELDVGEAAVLQFRKSGPAAEVVGFKEAGAATVDTLAMHDPPNAMARVPGALEDDISLQPGHRTHSVDTGPLVESNVDIWTDIDAALAKGRVETAAHGLRHHLEYVSRVLADQLGARPVFRADGNYELGDLLPSVLARTKELYGKAAEAAQSWGNEDAKQAAAAYKTALSESNGAVNVDQWAVNKAVHYNEWANFGRKDFEPVVSAFRDLLERFQCSSCGWLCVTPRGGKPEALRCQCSAVNLNLKAKPK